MDLANSNTAEAHFDERTERAEVEQFLIDSRVEDYLKDDSAVEELITENADVVWSIIKSGKDVSLRLNGSIRYWAENAVETELGI